jgi:SOS response regulatory protein OraA/RecX
VAGADALETALGALRHRELSPQELDERLARRGFTESDRNEVISTLKRTGLLDDHRFAEMKAESLAARGAGDALIRDALVRAGVATELAEDVLALLEPEAVRARAIVERRGTTSKTARYLAGKGFSRETIGRLVASGGTDEIG